MALWLKSGFSLKFSSVLKDYNYLVSDNWLSVDLLFEK